MSSNLIHARANISGPNLSIEVEALEVDTTTLQAQIDALSASTSTLILQPDSTFYIQNTDVFRDDQFNISSGIITSTLTVNTVKISSALQMEGRKQFFDSSKNKQNTKFFGLPVLPPTIIKEKKFDTIIISSYDYQEEMNEIIKKIDPNVKVIRFYDVVVAYDTYNKSIT